MPSTHRSVAFFADAMLGKLARWLRILGYDTAYERDVSDEELIERVGHEKRWLLTRDRYLAQRRLVRDRLTLLRADRVQNQLQQLMWELHLDLTLDGGTPCRCADCNITLEPIPKEKAIARVPPFVAAEHAAFSHCPRCTRIYWPGTHWDRIRLQLDHLRRP